MESHRLPNQRVVIIRQQTEFQRLVDILVELRYIYSLLGNDAICHYMLMGVVFRRQGN